MKKTSRIIVALALMICSTAAFADDDIKNEEFNPITTGVTSLPRCTRRLDG